MDTSIICETIEKWGVARVSDEELLTVLIGKDKAAKLLRTDENSLFPCKEQGLRCLSGKDVFGYRRQGLTKLAAARLAAAVEIGRRLAFAEASQTTKVSSPGDAAKILMPLLRNQTHEIFIILLLDTKNQVIKIEQIAEGSLTSAVVHPREVFAPAVVAHASSILCSHLHPSGIPTSSAEDKTLTTALQEAGDILGIPLLDHIIIGDGRYYSFKESGLL